MSRFNFDDGEGMPWGLWEGVVSSALGGRKGQAALAAMESALVALPEPRLIRDHIAADGAVCAVGALVAHQRAMAEDVDLATVIEAMSAGAQCWCGHARDKHTDGACSGKGWQDKPCDCDNYELDEGEDSIYETVDAGQHAGLGHTVAWHLAFLNDEQFASATPEQRYEKMLAWVRRAQGKPVPA